MVEQVQASDRKVSSQDNMTNAQKVNLMQTFLSACTQDKIASRSQMAATVQAAVVVLAFYETKYPGNTSLHRLSRDVGETLYEKKRADDFIADLCAELNLKYPTVEKGQTKGETFKRAENEYKTRRLLLVRGLEFAADLVTRDGTVMHTAEYALSWFQPAYQSKDDNGKTITRPMFVVPWNKLMKKGQSPLGSLHTYVNGGIDPQTNRKIAGNVDHTVALDGTTYAGMNGADFETFEATPKRIVAAAATYRTETRKTEARKSRGDVQPGTGASAGSAPAMQAASDTGAGAGRPAGQSNTQPAGGVPGLNLKAFTKELLNTMHAEPDKNAKPEDRYWSNNPMKDELNNLITALLLFREQAITFEVNNRRERGLPAARFADGELKTYRLQLPGTALSDSKASNGKRG